VKDADTGQGEQRLGIKSRRKAKEGKIRNEGVVSIKRSTLA